MPQVARPVSSQKAAICGPRRNGGPAFPFKKSILPAICRQNGLVRFKVKA
jgi:hypothetical protein